MNEQEMVGRAQAALERSGVEDRVEAAAIFLPRGHFGSAFAGGSSVTSSSGAGSGRPAGRLPGCRPTTPPRPRPSGAWSR